MQTQSVDVVIVGGGPAGMSAALVLGRARKRVLVIDEQRPRHAVAEGVHGFLTREGVSPAELRRIGRAELDSFANVAFIDDVVEAVDEGAGGGFEVRTRAGRVVVVEHALLLALGVVDEHPALPGYAEYWGRSIYLCPFCHGWEARDQAIGVLGDGEVAAHKAILLRSWSRDVVVFAHGEPLGEELSARLRAAEVRVEPARVVALEGDGEHMEHVQLADGRRVACQALFAQPPQRQAALVEALGVRLHQPHPLIEAPYVEVDFMMATSRLGVWAAGDCTTPLQSVAEAVAGGARAAAAITMRIAAGP